MSMGKRPARVYLVGGKLPKEDEYWGVEAALHHIAMRFAPIYKLTDPDKEKDSVKELLNYMLSQRYFQSFLIEWHPPSDKCSYGLQLASYEQVYELPIPTEDGENYVPSINLVDYTVSCGGRNGQLAIPRLDFQYGLEAYIQELDPVSLALINPEVTEAATQPKKNAQAQNMVNNGVWDKRRERFNQMKEAIDAIAESGKHKHHEIAKMILKKHDSKNVPWIRFNTSSGLAQEMSEKVLREHIKEYFLDTDREYLIHGLIKKAE